MVASLSTSAAFVTFHDSMIKLFSYYLLDLDLFFFIWWHIFCCLPAVIVAVDLTSIMFVLLYLFYAEVIILMTISCQFFSY